MVYPEPLLKLKVNITCKKNSKTTHHIIFQITQKNIAIVGCGNFAYSNIAYYLRKNFGDVIRVSMDKNMDRAASLFKDFNADYYTNNFKKVIEDDNVELIYIVSNHASPC